LDGKKSFGMAEEGHTRSKLISCPALVKRVEIDTPTPTVELEDVRVLFGLRSVAPAIARKRTQVCNFDYN